MTYTQVLNRSLELLDEEGPEAAYRFIKEEGFQVKNANEAQIYNFAYCFAALCGKNRKLWDCSKKCCIPRDTGMIITT